MRDVVVVPTGTANLASMLAALRRVGALPRLARDPSDVADASHVVLPGVGSFGAAAAALRRAGLRDALVDRVSARKATLAVCVGMQLLAEASEESPGAGGLGVIAATVTRFPDGTQVPQIGWSSVEPASGLDLIHPGWAYFANSYRLTTVPQGWLQATSEHGGRYVSAILRGEVLACQFHPELSGVWGTSLIERWLASTGEAA
jgi:imidazole glycerol phosphate synthase glutamine amidotransferase subunit